ncbi:MAG TPA: FAD-binding oxidoreductase [Dehalococcoidia bacterium]|nr:FAD-binding oxidoreductase [Dehalococcoidia bacterium]
MPAARLDLNDMQGFRGQLLRAGDPGYEDARRIHNGLIDKRPALIARCAGTHDVVAAIDFARANGLEIAVRGGGHNVAGRAVCEGGLMIDLSLMKMMTVDPRARIARAQPGLTWGEFNQVSQAHGLASTGGVVSSTGIAGLTLGGGLGWLMGKHGLAVDHLLAAEVVTATGDVVRADDHENADLLWGLRGGGGNFGVVTSFEYRLHPVGPAVVSGLVAHPVDDAVGVLRFGREFAESAPDDLSVQCALLFAPDGSSVPIAAIALCHCGPLEQAERDVRAVKAFDSPIIDAIGPQTYENSNTMMDAGFPKGALNYWKSSFLRVLSDAAIETLAGRFAECPSTMSAIVLERFHGAAARVPVTATAFPYREEGWNLLILAQWRDPGDTERNIAWARETHEAMARFMAPRRYVNYLSDDQPPDSLAEVYGANYERLRELKRKYDPQNLFHLNQNIRPYA